MQPVAVHLFLRREQEILMLKRFNTGYEDGNFSVVAGHVEAGENVYEAAVREAMEEAGIVPNDLEIVHVMNRHSAWGGTSQERIDYFLTCSNWLGEIHNQEPHKCSELRWVNLEELPENTIAYVQEAIHHYKSGAKFSVFGF